MKNGKNSVKRRDWKMATGTATTQLMSTQQQPQPQPQHQQHSKHSMNSSSMSFSNGTVSNGTGVTISNLGNYYTTNSNAVWSVYSNYMKPKSFKLR